MTKKNNVKMPALPALPTSRTASYSRCACGCQGLTQATFMPGHDSKLKAYVIRVERGAMTLADFAEWPGIAKQIEAVMKMRVEGKNPSFMRGVDLPEAPEAEGTGTEG